jgi:hypothetical protein
MSDLGDAQRSASCCGLLLVACKNMQQHADHEINQDTADQVESSHCVVALQKLVACLMRDDGTHDPAASVLLTAC